MNNSYDLIVIGAGSGGLIAASAGAGMGAKVLLIEGDKMGGDCLNHGCVPSKTFLKSCHLAQKIRNSKEYGINTDNLNVSLDVVMDRVSGVIKEIEPHDSKERYESLGVEVIKGYGKLVNKNIVDVNKTRFEGKKIIIATGSKPSIPKLKGIENIKYYTNENIFQLKELPERLIVLGAGPIGCELGQGFAQLGSKVHIINRSETIFKKDEPEVSQIMINAFKKDGMEIHIKCDMEEIYEENNEVVLVVKENGEVKNIVADAVLVSLGRTANSKNLGLEDVGIETDKRGNIIVNEKLQTSVKNIYAIGDVRGLYQFTHMASYEAGIAVRNALVGAFFKTNYYNVPWTTYTSPQVSHVGYTVEEAVKLGVFSKEHMIGVSENDRSKAEDDRDGFLKVVLNNKSQVIGATIVSEKADEMLPLLSLMVTKKMKIGEAMNLIFQYPIQGELVKAIAIKDFKENVKPWQKSLLDFIMKLNKGV